MHGGFFPAPLSVGPDRRAVGADRSAGAGEDRKPPGGPLEAADRGGDPVREPQRVRVADAAARIPALGHRVLVFPAVERGRDRRRDPRRAARSRPPDGRPGSHGLGRDRRLPGREGSDTVGKDSRGYDAGKKTNGSKRYIVTHKTGLWWWWWWWPPRPACRTATAGAWS